MLGWNFRAYRAANADGGSMCCCGRGVWLVTWYSISLVSISTRPWTGQSNFIDHLPTPTTARRERMNSSQTHFTLSVDSMVPPWLLLDVLFELLAEKLDHDRVDLVINRAPAPKVFVEAQRPTQWAVCFLFVVGNGPHRVLTAVGKSEIAQRLSLLNWHRGLLQMISRIALNGARSDGPNHRLCIFSAFCPWRR